MVKMLKIYISTLVIVASVQHARLAPQDMQTQALLLAGQMKEVAENGAAARSSKEIEFMGAKASGGFEFGFGDAVRHKRAALVKSIIKDSTLQVSPVSSHRTKRGINSSSSSSYASSESESSVSSSESDER